MMRVMLWTIAALLLNNKIGCAASRFSLPLHRLPCDSEKCLQAPTLRLPRAVTRNSGFGSLSLKNFMNAEYYGYVGIGTPPQVFALNFDTGSADMWVMSSRCKEFNYTDNYGCHHHRRYDSTASSTHKRDGATFSITYGEGSQDLGFVSYDRIKLGDWDVIMQAFGEVLYDRKSWNGFADGVMGLGYPQLAYTGKDTPFISLVKQGHLDSAVFSFQLSKDDQNMKGGEVTFGGIDPAYRENDIVYTNVTHQKWWEIEIDRAEIAIEPPLHICSGCPAIVDTGTAMMWGPKDAVDSINSYIGAVPGQRNLWTVSCNSLATLPDIQFIVGGRSLKITPEDYIKRLTSTGGTKTCFSGFLPVETRCSVASCWVLGSLFIGAFYTVFDMESNRIGFASRKNTSASFAHPTHLNQESKPASSDCAGGLMYATSGTFGFEIAMSCFSFYLKCVE